MSDQLAERAGQDSDPQRDVLHPRQLEQRIVRGQFFSRGVQLVPPAELGMRWPYSEKGKELVDMRLELALLESKIDSLELINKKFLDKLDAYITEDIEKRIPLDKKVSFSSSEKLLLRNTFGQEFLEDILGKFEQGWPKNISNEQIVLIINRANAKLDQIKKDYESKVNEYKAIALRDDLAVITNEFDHAKREISLLNELIERLREHEFDASQDYLSSDYDKEYQFEDVIYFRLGEEDSKEERGEIKPIPDLIKLAIAKRTECENILEELAPKRQEALYLSEHMEEYVVEGRLPDGVTRIPLSIPDGQSPGLEFERMLQRMRFLTEDGEGYDMRGKNCSMQYIAYW